MLHWRERGFVRCVLKGDGDNLPLRADQLEEVTHDWMNGNAFGQYVGMYDQRVWIKLGEIQGIMEITPESIALEDEDTKIDKQRELTE